MIAFGWQRLLVLVLVTLLFCAAALGPLYLRARKKWRAFKALPDKPAFHYSITDMWAGIVAFTPTMLAVGYIANHFARGDEFILTIFLGVTQILGMVIGKLEYECRRGQGTVSSAIYITFLPGLMFLPLLLELFRCNIRKVIRSKINTACCRKYR